jgi:glycosyltransferase involved in cell wall biosynthesis
MLIPSNLDKSKVLLSNHLKLLFISDAFTLGYSRYFFEMCQYLVKQGHQITILGGDTDKHIPRRRMVDNILIFQYYREESRSNLNPFRIILKTLSQNYRLFNEIQKTLSLDSIVFWQPLSALGVWLHPSARNIPKVYFFLCPWHKEYAQNVRLDEIKRLTPKFIWHYFNVLFRKWVEWLMIRSCRRIMVLSEFGHNELLETHSINPSRIEFVPGALDISKYKPLGSKQEQRQKLNIPKDKCVLFTLRRLVPRMGLENLIEAMPLILKANPCVYLVIGGIGPLRDRLEKLSCSLGLERAIRFEGFIDIDKLPAYYNAADLFILPTKALEGFGLITIEALACGVPVLGTPVGATKEVLGKFNPALLFKGVSSKDMADLIIKFSLKSAQELTDLGWQGREFVLRNYTWNIVGSKIEKVCQSVTQKLDSIYT